MRQVIICELGGHVISNRITEHVPAVDSYIIVDRNTYKVTTSPMHIQRSKPDGDLFKDAIPVVARGCDENDVAYLRALFVQGIAIKEGNGAFTVVPDEIVVVAVKPMQTADALNAVEAALRKYLF